MVRSLFHSIWMRSLFLTVGHVAFALGQTSGCGNSSRSSHLSKFRMCELLEEFDVVLSCSLRMRELLEEFVTRNVRTPRGVRIKISQMRELLEEFPRPEKPPARLLLWVRTHAKIDLFLRRGDARGRPPERARFRRSLREALRGHGVLRKVTRSAYGSSSEPPTPKARPGAADTLRDLSRRSVGVASSSGSLRGPFPRPPFTSI